MNNSSPFAAARRLGFTLMEMLVVLTIMAVLTTVAFQSLEPVAQKSRAEATMRTLESVRGALLSTSQTAGSTTTAGFLTDMRRLPTSFAELYSNPTASPLWRGPYVLPPTSAATLVDGWNRPLRMTFADTVGVSKLTFDSVLDTLVLASDGPDGTAGNDDDVVVRIPGAQVSAREIRVRLYGVDAQGFPVDLGATTPKVTITALGMTGTAQATATEGLDRVYSLAATPAELLAGTYQVTVTDATVPDGQTGIAYNTTTRVSVLPGGIHAVDVLVFRGSAPEPEEM